MTGNTDSLTRAGKDCPRGVHVVRLETTVFQADSWLSKFLLRTVVITAAFAMCAGTLSAQEYVDFGSRQYVPFGPIQNTPDWDWFAPVTDHIMDQAQSQSDGYFFSYERLHWWLSKSDRAQVGAEAPQSVNAFYSHSVQSVYDDAELSQRTLFVAPGGFVDFGNSVTSSNPVTINGWGNRWELGYVQDRWGWMVSVLDRMNFNGSTWYGADDKRRFQLAAAQGLDGVDGEFTGQLVVIGTDPTFRAPIAAVPSIQALLAIDGLLTVHMIFEDPFNSLLGFIDNNGDGVSDDINGDGIIDDNDRVRFGVTYDEMHITNQTYLSGVELMSIRRKLPTYHGAFVEVFLGARYVQFDDRYDAVAYGGILADSAWSQRCAQSYRRPRVWISLAKAPGPLEFRDSGAWYDGSELCPPPPTRRHCGPPDRDRCISTGSARRGTHFLLSYSERREVQSGR